MRQPLPKKGLCQRGSASVSGPSLGNAIQRPSCQMRGLAHRKGPISSVMLPPAKRSVRPSVERFLATQQLVGCANGLFASEQPIQPRLDVLSIDVG